MIQEKIKNHTAYTISKIDESKNVDDSDKLLFRELIQNCEAATNGLTPEEKLQKTSENLFYLTSLIVLEKCKKEESKLTGLYKMIVDCKWQICIVVGLICLSLIFRPELSSLITTLMK